MSILKFQPCTEQEVIALFCSVLNKLGFTKITRLGASFPDCKAIRKRDGKEVNIEFEYCSNNFILHGHDKNKCDYIVCWVDDASKSIGPKVIELYKMFRVLRENPKPKRGGGYNSKYIMKLCFDNKKGLTVSEFKREINKSHEDYRVSEARCLVARLIYGNSKPTVKNGRLLIKKMPVFKDDRWAVAGNKKLMQQADVLLKKFGYLKK
ncbi:MAG: hypothetical protein V1871_09245 [Planctomycetota bacterium]